MKKMILGTLIIMGTLLSTNGLAKVGPVHDEGGNDRESTTATVSARGVGGSGCTDCDMKNGYPGDLTRNTNKAANVEDGSLGGNTEAGQ